MTPEDAIRFLDHQAKQCRGRDAGEALCLLLPAMMEILGMDRMEEVEAAAFKHSFKKDLAARPDRLKPAEDDPKLPCGPCGFGWVAPSPAAYSGTDYAIKDTL